MTSTPDLDSTQAPEWITSIHTANPLYVVDLDQRVVYWDPRATDEIGLRPDVIGLPCYEALPGLNPRNARQCRPNCQVIAMARAGQVAPDFTIWGTALDGEPQPIDISVLLHDGGPQGTPTVAHLARPRSTGGNAGCSDRVPLEHVTAPGLDGDCAPLTRRQLRTLELLAEGRSPGEIASVLQVRPVTVRNHLQGAMDRLNAHTRIEAIATATRLGLL
jgi:DNA-binding CsgD family transcriptional regulator